MNFDVSRPVVLGKRKEFLCNLCSIGWGMGGRRGVAKVRGWGRWILHLSIPLQYSYLYPSPHMFNVHQGEIPPPQSNGLGGGGLTETCAITIIVIMSATKLGGRVLKNH